MVPTLASCQAASGRQGQIQTATCSGSNFVSGATTLAFSGTGVIVDTVTVQDSTSLTAHWTLGGATGTRGISVTTPNGSSNSINFTINPDNLSGALTFNASTFAGTPGAHGHVNGASLTAKFQLPEHIWSDGASLYVADSGNGLRQLVFGTGQVSTIASGTFNVSGLNNPTGVWATQHKVYIADTANHVIKELNISDGVVTVIAGSAGVSGSGNGPGADARFNGPKAVWGDGFNLYVADTGNFLIRRIDLVAKVVTTVAGSAGVNGFADGATATFGFVDAIAGDGAGTLWVADTSRSTIREINLATGVVTRVAGISSTAGSVDGPWDTSKLTLPRGMWTDGNGYLYFVDANAFRRLHVSTRVVSTLTLTGGSLNNPTGLWSDGQVFYVSNRNGSFISRLTPVAAPALASAQPNAGNRGANVSVTLTGMNFVAGATTVSVAGNGITVTDVVVQSSTSLTAVFMISADAATGNRAVTVTTSGGTTSAVDFTVSSSMSGQSLLLTSPMVRVRNEKGGVQASGFGARAVASPMVRVRNETGGVQALGLGSKVVVSPLVRVTIQ